MNASQIVEILLVEDSPEDMELTCRALKKANLGNHIHIARDGAEALDFLFCEGPHSSRRIEDSPKLVLLDLKLPKVHGMDLLQRIKSDARTRHIPVAILTSSKEQADVVRGYACGVNSYIVKPMEFEGFSHAVQSAGMYWLLLNQPQKIEE